MEKDNKRRMAYGTASIFIVILMSVGVYFKVMAYERQSGLDMLRDSAITVAERISLKFTDDINLLRLSAGVIAQTGEIDIAQLPAFAEKLTTDGKIFSDIESLCGWNRFTYGRKENKVCAQRKLCGIGCSRGTDVCAGNEPENRTGSGVL